LIAGVGLAILFAYDAKWFLLPDVVSFSVIGLGVITSILAVMSSNDILATVISIIGSVAILSGLYYLLYVLSRGQWIGFGDIKLGLGLALLLADWRLAFVALFAANIIGCLIVLPAMAMGTLKRNSHVPFGPLLIAGAIAAQFTGIYLVETYLFLVV
jgi:prepilin signal peptidase PulO-like enzyme (type II secretory pathway)